MRRLYMSSPVYLYVYNEGGFPTEVCTFCDIYFVNIWVIFGAKEVVLHCLFLKISYVDGTLL